MRFAIKPMAALQASAVTLALYGLGMANLRADVVPIGDVSPAIDPVEDPGDPPSNELVTDLPQFGGAVPDIVIVGGTNFFVGNTSTGQLTIDIPSDTDPLISPGGIIGGSALGLGQARILGLNSEWRSTAWMIVGYQGQGFLDLAAGGRMQVVLEDGVDGIVINPAITSLQPWLEYDLMLGAFEGSQGYAEIDGFASLVYSGNVTVGFRGQGHIDMINGSRMVTRNVASIGTRSDVASTDAAVGNGYVLVDGPGTRWNIGLERQTGSVIPPMPGGGPGSVEEDTLDGKLFIGQQGRGALEVRNQGWVRVETTTRIGDVANSYGRLSVADTDSLFWTLDDLIVGNVAGTAAGDLQISNYGLVRADGNGTNAGGVLVGTLGTVDFASSGRLVAPTVVNNGVIRGDGRVESLSVLNNGDIRTAAGIANIRERLHFTGAVVNTVGSIMESIGGEMIFDQPVLSNGQIFGRNAIFRFMGGLTDNGNATYLDNSVVESPLVIISSLAVGTSGASAFMGDLNFSGGGTLSMEIGQDFSQLFVTGTASLAGEINFTLAEGFMPESGDSFKIIDAGALSGTFGLQTMSPDPGLLWTVDYLGDDVFLTFGGSAPIISADFNGDGIVDAADLALITGNFGLTPATMADGDANGDGIVDGSDLLIWQQQLGTSPGPAVPVAAPASGVVPEPTGLALALFALGGLALRRTGRAAVRQNA